jgi:putative DNA primase/helicase
METKLKPDFTPIEGAAIPADDFLQFELPPKKNILNPWLREQSIILISGWRGTGKTWFCLSIFDAISRGQAFGPWEVQTPMGCLYIDAEMSAGDIQERLYSLDRGASRKRAFPLVIYSDAYANSKGIPRADLRKPIWRRDLMSYLMDEGLKLVAFDNIASLCPGGDENVKKDWDPVNQFLLELRFKGITSILLHHTNKSGDQRGTSAREDNIDISMTLFQPGDYTSDQGARFVVKFKKTRIAVKDLSLMHDLEFQLTEVNDRTEWAWMNIKKKNKLEVLRLLDEGVQQTDIASSLGVTKGYISQVKAQAIKDGYLSSKGKLTQSGFMLVGSPEEEP